MINNKELSELKNIIYEYDSMADLYLDSYTEEFIDKLDSIRNRAIGIIENLKKYNDYYVWTEYGQWDNMWIVSAKNKKEAIDKVYQKYIIPMNEEIKEENKRVGYKAYRPCNKKELEVKSIEDIHKENGDIVLLD